jgi:hypothetical protein
MDNSNKSDKISPSPNPSPVKREGLPEGLYPFPSLRGEGAGVRGKVPALIDFSIIPSFPGPFSLMRAKGWKSPLP